MPLHWSIGPSGPTDEQLREIAQALANGVVILPTDTIYGFHAIAENRPAVERITSLKGRDGDRPMITLLADMEQLETTGAAPPENVLEFLRTTWPAPLTAIVPLALRRQIDGRQTIALRMPAVAWLRRLIRATGPLVSTSVNRTGEAPFYNTDRLPEEVKNDVDGIVHAGLLRGEASTIVDFTREPPEILRAGPFRFRQELWKTPRKSL